MSRVRRQIKSMTQLYTSNSIFRRVLLIGSCLSENLALRIRLWLKKENRDPDALYHLQVNHLATLPEEPEAQIESYSFQIIQPPLRGVFGWLVAASG